MITDENKIAQLIWFRHMKSMTNYRRRYVNGCQSDGEKGRDRNNLVTAYSSDNERTRIGGLGLGIQICMDNNNKHPQEDEDIVKPDSK